MMRLPKFEYHVPRTVAEAVRIMGESGPAGQFVAGGTDLYPNMKRRQQMPKSVISVMRLEELNQITGDGPSGLRIGASVTLTEICSATYRSCSHFATRWRIRAGSPPTG